MLEDVNKKIEDFILTYNKANVDHNKPLIREMLGDVKHLKHITGYVQHIDEWFEDMDKGIRNYRRFEMGPIEILDVKDNIYEVSYKLTIVADSVWPFRNTQKLIIHEDGTINWFNVNHFEFDK